MTDPVAFTSATPNYSLPFLFAGQAQKEFFVNQAHTRMDALVHTAIVGRSASSPASSNDGDSWLVDSSPTGEWAGFEGHIATRVGAEWSFIQPRAGMRVFDQHSGQMLLFDGAWQSADAPAQPQNGTTIDVEARQAITEIISELRNLGIFARS